jgi:integrase
MARTTINRLSDRKVRTAKVGTTKAGTAKPGMHPDGGGLYLRVTDGKEDENGARILNRYWLFRYASRVPFKGKDGRDGKPGDDRQIGIGPLDTISLAQARSVARECREQLLAGLDPIEEREKAKCKSAAATAKTITFAKAAETYIASHEAGWRNDKHRKQWTTSLKTYAYPVIGHLAVREIDIGLIMQVLQPMWTVKPETAGRVRGRIQRVLGWCKVNGYREGENPARWTDNLDQLLPARGKIRKVEPQPALPYEQIGAFMADLREQAGTAARALEFAILNAGRSGEVRGMRWDGNELAGNVWTCPAERMKGNREHRVPLTASALAVIERMREQRRVVYVFPGEIKGEPLSDMALTEVIRRMNDARGAAGLPRWTDPSQGGRDVVPHGFRSTFRDWVSEETSFADYLGEAALAHAKGDKVEAAYKRGDVLAKRRHLMEAWASYCDSAPAGSNVVQGDFGRTGR